MLTLRKPPKKGIKKGRSHFRRQTVQGERVE